MNGKIPAEAFSFYVGLQDARSYQAVADRYGVSKRAVVKAAAREKWPERLAAIEQRARETADQKLQESIAEMNVRHLQVMRFIQAKAIEALKTMPLDTAMEAIKAYSLSLDKERLIRGEPGQRTEVSVAEATRREIDRFVATDPDDAGDDLENDDDDGSNEGEPDVAA
jgi:hypothetical protein